MSFRQLLPWLGALALGLGFVAWLASTGDEPASSIVPAGHALPVTVHLDGEAVATLTPGDLVDRTDVVGVLPERARDPAAWTTVRVFGVRGSQFVLEHPAERLRERQLLLYLQPNGHPAAGLFRRLTPTMSAEVRATLAAPGLFLPRVTDVYVWTVEEPRKTADAAAPTLEIAVQGTDTVTTVTAAQVQGLAPVARDATEGHDGRRVLDIVGLVVDAARVERVRIAGGGAPVDLNRAQLRAPDVRALVRLNKRGIWAFDASGRLPDGAPVSGRLRGVTRLVVALGTAEALAETPRSEPQVRNGRRRTQPTPEEKARIDALMELTRKAPDPDARADILDALRDPSAHVRLRAARSLRVWEDSAADLFAHLDMETDAEVQRACVRAVGDRGDAGYIDELGRWAEGRSKRLRKDADKARRRIAKREGLATPERLDAHRR